MAFKVVLKHGLAQEVIMVHNEHKLGAEIDGKCAFQKLHKNIEYNQIDIVSIEHCVMPYSNIKRETILLSLSLMQQVLGLKERINWDLLTFSERFDLVYKMKCVSEMMDGEIKTDEGFYKMAISYAIYKKAFDADNQSFTADYNSIYS